jgi:hypothetical protein
MGISTRFIWIVILFDEIFKYGEDTKYWGYVETDIESLYVEFCNFVHCHIFQAYFFLRGSWGSWDNFSLSVVCVFPQ